MFNTDIRKVLRSRLLEYHGYKNRQIRIMNAKKQIVGNLFSLMPVIVMTIFVISAFFIGLTYMKFSGQLTADGSGLIESTAAENFAKLSLDDDFKIAVKNTFMYTGITAGFSLFWSLVLASLINLSRIRGRKLFVIGFFLPQVTSEVASTIIFTAMMKNPFSVNENPQNWFWIMAIIGMWATTAASFVIFNTAFANIGKTEYEAASLDGANAFTKFWKITIPALAPIIAYQLMMSVVIGMTAFGASYVMLNMQYVTGTNKENVILWPVIGFIRVKGGSKFGYASNVGLGMIELLILGATLVGLTLISNFIQPIQGRK